MISNKALALLALAGSGHAHTMIQWYWPDNSIANSLSSNIRMAPNNSPIQDVNSASMACNINGNTPAATKQTVAAGATIKLEWHHTNRVQGPTDSDDPTASSHLGPIITYMAKVNNALTETAVSSLNWFKIQQDGLSGGKWAVQTFRENKGVWTFTIPANIPPGDYLIRQETIALHSAGSPGGAQLYMGCAQVTVTGGSASCNPGPTVKFPGAYKSNDPGILYNLYGGSQTYVIPGPPLFSCSGSTNPPPPTTTVVTPPPTTTLVTRVSSSSARPATSSPAPGGCTAARYAQCGGNGFTGCTTCAAGSTCVAVSPPYYSQCQ